MISVHGENGRKGIGLGFGRANMEEVELEEGEASFDSSIDPDIALSYIDEKLQDVLGHFQKDFEGGVSAENLGAKFGGYGSFLPTYQRSPSWSHPRTPPEVYNHNKSMFPNNTPVEVACQNSFSAPTTTFLVRPGKSMPEPGASSGTDDATQDVSVLSNIVDGTTSKVGLEKSGNSSDQKALKFRIKVGIDNLSTCKNAEIYSGLGLDVSPSSSLDDSPMDSEGLLYHDLDDTPDESPTSILQIMTSVKLFGGILLTPLSNDVSRVTEKGLLWGESKSKVLRKENFGVCKFSRSESDLATTNGKVYVEKKSKLVEKSAVSVSQSSNNCKDTFDGVVITSKKDQDNDHSSCEELVSNALKLPLLSSDCITDAKEIAKSVTISTTPQKNSVKYDYHSNVPEEEILGPVAQNCRVEKSNRKISLSEKVRGNSKPTSIDEKSVYQKKEVNHKEDKADFAIKTRLNVTGERKYSKVDDPKQNVYQKVTSHDEDGLKSNPGEVQSSSGGKRKSKGNQSQCSQGTECVEDGLAFNSSMVPKNKKTSNIDIPLSKTDSEGLRNGKATDKYKDFFGDLNIGHEDEKIALEKLPPVQMVRDCELVEKRSMSESNIVNERPHCKKIEGISVSGNHPKSSSFRPLPTGKRPNHDAATSVVTPLVKEYWVCCDKCHTWRLLPLGTNPESLPEKWLCSMLDWLPGMNHCSVTEEETASALRAVQAPVASLCAASGIQINQHAHPGGTVLGVSPVDTRRSNEDCHLSGTQAIVEKKWGSKDIASENSENGPIQSSNPMKNLLACAKDRNSDEVDISLSFDEFGSQYIGQAGQSVVGRYGKDKEKKILRDSNSSKGDANKSQMKNPRESEINGLRASKKIRTEDVGNRDENCSSDHGITSSKAGQSSSSASLNDPYNYSNYSRDLKGDLKRKWSSEKLEVQVSAASDDASLKIDKSGNDNFEKKKGKEQQNAHVDCMPVPSSQNHPLGRKGFSEDTRENDRRKEKKARVSKSEGKGSHGNKDDVTPGRKARGFVDQTMERDLDRASSQRSIDAPDSFRRDLDSGQPSMAATSSSSKVSGSHKSRTNHKEIKGSPVESVSSSPLRISNSDKWPQAGKEDLQDAGFFAEASPRRSLDGEDVGLGEQSLKVKDDTPNVIHHMSLESTVHDFQVRDLDDVASVMDKTEVVSSTGFVAQYVPESKVNALGEGSQNASQVKTLDIIQDEEKRNYDQHASKAPHSKKSGKGSSSRSKEKIRSSISVSENGNESSYEERLKTGRNKFQEKSGVSSDRTESRNVSKKDSDGKTVRDTSKVGGHDGSIVRPDAVMSQDLKQNVAQDCDDDRSSRKLVSDKAGAEVAVKRKSHSFLPSLRGQADQLACPRPIDESQKENGENKELDTLYKVSKPSKRAEKQNGSRTVNLRHPTPTHKSRDLDAPSPVRRDSSSQAVTNAVKEAKDLKHLADRLKNNGSNDSTGLYFQAALKFLHGASLLESGNSENTKHNEMIQSMQMYSSTAKLCEFCAHEYEKSKDMVAAALAYKCMEVAYMRVIYTSQNSASRDRNELQAALQILPTGESPSSSASDIDNLNNPVNIDKALQAKGVGSPQVAGNNVFTAQNRSSFMRLINYAQDVNNAMEASRKSRNAFGAANPKMDGPQHKEGISSVKRALDFSFQDVDGLLRLVRVAMEAINR